MPANRAPVARWLGAVLAASILLGGCGSTGGVPAGSTIPSDQPELPERLTFARDDDAAARFTATFEEGGTATATGSDGTSYTLDVPPMAVASDVEITLTPLRDVAGLVDDSVQSHAVDLEPDGLAFHLPARLTIVPASEIAVEEQVAFIAASDGTDSGMAPVDPGASDMVLLVDHFSVAGVARFTPEQRRLFARKSAATAEAALERRVADRLSAERTAQLTGSDPTTDAATELAGIAEEFTREVLDKLRSNAESSCADLAAYVRRVISWERQFQLAGTTEGEEAASKERVADAVASALARREQCEKEAIDRCRAESDPGILVAFWLSMGDQPDPGMAERAEKICGGQDLRIDHTVGATQLNVTFSIRYTATKCGGPEGSWEIDSAGTLSGYGGSATIGGPLVVEIGEGQLSGPLTGTANFSGGTGQTVGSFVGTGTYVDEPPTLEIEVTDGSGDGYLYGFLDTGFMQPGTLTLPVETGAFCD